MEAPSNSQKYLLVRIEKTAINTNTYKDIDAEISVLPSNISDVVIPIEQYHFGNLKEGINTSILYKLRKNMETDTIIRLEFSKNSDEINYAFKEKKKEPNDIKQEVFYDNSSTLEKKSSRKQFWKRYH